MATFGMMNEFSKRAYWLRDVNTYVRENASDPHIVASWPDVRDLYEEGQSAADAGRKFLEREHLGENS